jgi:hypothetical protein
MTKTTAAMIANLKRDLVLMSRIADNISTSDFEEIDALHRTIRDASGELFELELSFKAETDEDGELVATF